MKLKLNNRGWGLSTFLVYLTIFIVFIGVVTILAIHNANKFKDADRNDQNTSSEVSKEESKEESNKIEKKSDFKQIEKDLEKAAYQYQQEYLVNMQNGEIKYVTASKLEELKLLDNLTNGDYLCTGYAKITSNNGKIDIMPFINCGEYISEGYNEELE